MKPVLRRIAVLVHLLWVSVFFQVQAQTAIAPASGNGDPGNPYQIATWQNLYWISQNSSEWGKHFVQTADIDFADASTAITTWDGGAGWTPIGLSSFVNPFSGIYNGDGYTISNLFINRPLSDRIGLFGGTNNATITNLGLLNVSVIGRDNVGALSGEMENTSISKCFVSGGNVVGQPTGIGPFNLGALIGRALSGGALSDIYTNVLVQSLDLINGNSSGLVGGFSFTQPSISNVYIAGLIHPDALGPGFPFGPSFIRHIIGQGYTSGNCSNCFFDNSINTSVSANGATGRTTFQMQQQSTFTNWDFQCEVENGTADIWGIDEGNGYPVLSVFGFVQSCPCLVNAIEPSNGDGLSLATAYQISSFENLLWITEDPSRWDKFYIQTANINASVTGTDTGCFPEGWSPIGNSSTKFTGSYDGGGYTITGLSINRPTTDRVGLFGDTEGATISNLGLIDVNIIGANLVGGLIGVSAGGGSVSQCFVVGGEISGNNSEDGFIGGLIGRIFSGTTVNNVYTIVVVENRTNTQPAAGLIGQYDGISITNAYVAGPVNPNAISPGGPIPASVNRRAIGTSNGGFCNNCFFNNTVNPSVLAGQGQGRSTAQMLLRSTFTGFDFDAIWTMQTLVLNGFASYPYFGFQVFDASEAPGAVPAGVSNRTQTLNFTSVQLAIDLAAAGDEITMGIGTYVENVSTIGAGGVSLSTGNSPGCTTIDGNFTLTSDDEFLVEIEGETVCTEYDRLTVTGNVVLGGADLIIDLSFAPAISTSFTILEYNGTLTGTFAQTGTFQVSFGSQVYDVTIDYGTGSNSAITLEISPCTPPAIDPLSGEQNICQGASTTFTTGATPGGTFTSADETIATVDPSTGLVTGIGVGTTTITYTIEENGCPASVTREVNVSVAAVGVITSEDQVICVGSTPLPLSIPADTGAVIQWQISSNNVNFVNLTGETNPTLNLGPASATRFYRARLTIGSCVTFSSTVEIAVTAAPVESTISADQEICAGNIPSPLNLIGATTGIQWESSTDNVNFTPVVGATGSSLIFSAPVTQSTFYRAVISSGACLPFVTNVVSIEVDPLTSAGTITPNDQVICPGTQGGPLTVTGAVGELQWQTSTNGVDNWVDIDGATDATLSSAQIGTLNSTRFYRVAATSGLCGITFSNAVPITVDFSAAGIISEDQAICTGSTPADITLTGFSGTIVWQSSLDNVNFTTIAGQTGATLPGTALGAVTQTTNIRALVSGTCTNVPSPVHTITVNPIPPAPIAVAAQDICDASGATLADIAVTGSGIKWYDAATNGVELPLNTVLVNGATYFASQTLLGCESTDRVAVAVNLVEVNLAAPNAPPIQYFSPTITPRISNLVATGTNVQWFADEVGGVALASSLALVDGTTYWAQSSQFGCSSPRTPVLVQISSFSSEGCGLTLVGNPTYCANDIIELRAINISPEIAGNIRQWSQLSGPSALLSINTERDIATISGVVSGGYYVFQFQSRCESGLLMVEQIGFQVVNTPTADAGDSIQACPGDYQLNAAPLATGESGLWSIVQVENALGQLVTPGSIQLINPTSPTATVRFLEGVGGLVGLRWTVTNTLTGCSDSDIIEVFNCGGEPIDANRNGSNTINLNSCYNLATSRQVTPSYAGQTSCGVESGYDFLSGPSQPSIQRTTLLNGQFSYVFGNLIEGTYTFRYKVEGGCFNGEDTLTLIVPAAEGGATPAGISFPSQFNSTITVPIEQDPGTRNFSTAYICKDDNPSSSFIFTGTTPQNAGETVSWNLRTVTGFNSFTGVYGTATYSGPMTLTPNTPFGQNVSLNNLTPGLYEIQYTIETRVDPSDPTSAIRCTSTAFNLVQIVDADVSIEVNGGESTFLMECGTSTFSIPLNETGGDVTEFRILSAPAPLQGSSSLTTDWAVLDNSATPGFFSVSGVQGAGEYVFEFRRKYQFAPSASLCGIAYTQLSVIKSNPPSTAIVGGPQQICGSSVTNLTALAPTGTSTGRWTQVSGPSQATIASPLQRNTAVSGLVRGTYVFRWTVSNGPACPSSSADVQVKVSPNLPVVEPQPATVEVCFGQPIQVQGKQNLLGDESISWSVVPSTGVNFSSTTVSSPIVTGLAANTTYTFTYTITNGCGTANQTFTVTTSDTAGALPANAGPDLCLPEDTESFNLAGNLPAEHSGLWTVISQPTGSIINFTDATSSTTSVSIDTPGVYVLEWTLTRDGASACGTTADQVTINVTESLDNANAGPDIIICDNEPVTLQAEAPNVGSGSWTQTGGPGGLVVTNPTSPNTTVTGFISGQFYTLRWTVSLEGCSAQSSFDEMVLIPSTGAPEAIAPAEQNICEGTSGTVTATAADGGFWSFISGPTIPTFANASLATTNIANLVPGTYQLAWNVPAAGDFCEPSSAPVTLRVSTIANAGPDLEYCGSVTTIPLNGNGSVGTWTFVSGPATPTITTIAPTQAQATGLTAPGVYTFEYSIAALGIDCPQTTDLMTVTINGNPTTIADAGPTQELCNATEFTLAANDPALGEVGTWSIISGAGGSFADINNPNTTFTGAAPGTYIFRWTIASADGCSISNSSRVWLYNYPTVTDEINSANAGADQSICTTTAILSGNTPINFTNPQAGALGTWTIVSQPGGGNATIVSPNSPSSQVTGLNVLGDYVFRWTISVDQGLCSASDSDDIIISVTGSEVLADAGLDQELCLGEASIQLNADAGQTGVWSQVSGPAGSFNNSALPNASFTPVLAGTYVFRWTVGTGDCQNFDEVTVQITNPPSLATVLEDNVSVCLFNDVTLTALAPAVGTGQWSQVSGPTTAQLLTPTALSTNVVVLVPGTYVFRWTVSNGGVCGVSTADVTLTALTTVTQAKTNSQFLDICRFPETEPPFAGSITLEANTPGLGETGTWEFVSGPTTITFDDINSPTVVASGFTNFGEPSTYRIKWVISAGSGCNPTEDEIEIRLWDEPTEPLAGTYGPFCNAPSFALNGNLPVVGEGEWEFVSGPSGLETVVFVNPLNQSIEDPTNPQAIARGRIAGALVDLIPGTYVLSWNIANGPACTPKRNETTIINLPPLSAAASGNAQICEGGDQTLSFTPFGGTGFYSYQWQVSDGTCSGVWTDIPGATGTSYTTPSLFTTTRYRFVITDIGDLGNGIDPVCTTPYISSCFTVFVVEDPVITSVSITPTEFCADEDAKPILSVNATGGTPFLTYVWEQRTGPGENDWTVITVGEPDGGTLAAQVKSLQAPCPRPAFVAPSCDCPTGMVAVGYTAEIGNIYGEDVISSFTLECRQINQDGTWVAGQDVTVTCSNGSATGTRTESVIASPNTALVGFSNRIGCGIDLLQGRSKPLSEILAGGSNTNNTLLAGLGGLGGTIQATQLAPAGYAIVGMTTYLDGDFAGGYAWRYIRLTDLFEGAEFSDCTVNGGDGEVRVTVSASGRGCDTEVSAPITFSVACDAIFTDQPESINICANETTTLTATVEGGAGITRYWVESSSTFDGIFTRLPAFPEDGIEINPTLVGGDIYELSYETDALTQNAFFRFVVTQEGLGCDQAVSEVAGVYVPTIVEQPLALRSSACESDIEFNENTFTVLMEPGFAGDDLITYTYQWQILTAGVWENVSNDNPLGAVYAGATTEELTVSGITGLGTYEFRVVVIPSVGGIACASITSDVVTYEIVSDPVIVTQPEDGLICTGETYTMTVEGAGGTPGPVYQWQRENGFGTDNWINITGATNTSYTTPALSTNTRYRVFVTAPGNACETGFSRVVTVTVNSLTPGTISSNFAAVCEDEGPNAQPTINLTGTVASSPNAGAITYQWQASTTGVSAGFVDISGATGQNYTSAVLGQTTWFRRIATSTLTVTGGSPSPIGPSACDEISNVVQVVVNPVPVVNSADTKTIRDGDAVAYTITSDVVGSSFTWTSVAETPDVTGNTASGNGAEINDVLLNSSNVPLIVTYTITPTGPNPTDCTGDNFTFVVTVNPTPDVAPVSDQVLCAGESTAPISFTGDVAGTVFRWTNSNPSIGLAASGTGNILSFTTVNPTSVARVATITVTPEFTNNGVTGFGDPETFTITVNPVPAIAAKTTTICNETSFTITPVNGVGGDVVPAGTTYTWTVSNNPAVTGASDQDTPQSSISQTLTNTSLTAQQVVYTVTPVGGAAVGSCTGAEFTVTVTVQPTPNVSIVNNAPTICSGSTTNIGLSTTITGTTPGVSYTWTATLQSGTATFTSSGSGAPTGQVITNTSNTPAVVRYTVTPAIGACTGPAETVDVQVLPNGIANQPVAQVHCHDAEVPETVFTTSQTGFDEVTYNWSVTNGTTIGLPANSGTGNLPAFTAINTGTAPTSRTVSVTMTYTKDGISCTGAARTFTITINPLGQVNDIIDRVVCHNQPTTVNFSTVNTGGTTTYAWSYAGDAIGLAASGTGNISFTAQNTSNAQLSGIVTVTPTFTNGGQSCPGPSKTFTITVNPSGQVNAIDNQTLCAGEDTQAITFSTSRTDGSTTYTWTNNNTGIGLAASSGGTATGIPSFTAINATNIPITATITVTPTYSNDGVSCVGTPQTFTITVNPTPQINNKTAEICDDGTFTITPVNGAGGDIVPAGTTYSWIVTPNANVTGEVDGSGSDISGTLTNDTDEVQIVVYTVTPTSGSCVGESFTVTVTLNPKPKVTATPANETICTGDDTGITLSTVSTGTTAVFYRWTAAIQTAPAGGTITGFTNHSAGTLSEIVQTLTNSGTSPGVVRYVVTPFIGDCAGDPINVDITVNPSATVVVPTDAVVCNAEEDVTIPAFGTTNTGGTVTYAWTNDTPGIGLAASGTGNIPLFTAINTGTAPIVATITVTPTFTNDGVSCPGASDTFTITVNPWGQVNDPVDQTVCNDEETTIAFTTNNTGGTTTYNWTNDNTTIGLAASGSISDGGNNGTATFTFDAVNTGTEPISATITVTPVFENEGVFCSDNSRSETFTITVNPTAQVNPVTDIEVCGNDLTQVNFSTNRTGGVTTYTWVNTNPGIGLAATGSGNISFNAVNFGAIPIIGEITVTPRFEGGCEGPSETFTITVNPTPIVTSNSTKTILSGENVGYNITSNVPGTTYTWTAVNTVGTVTGFTASGSGALIDDVLVNVGPANGTITYTIQPFGPAPTNCPSPPFFLVVTVENGDPKIGVAKELVSVVRNAAPATTFRATYQIRVRNFGNTPLEKVQINFDMVDAFGAGNFDVVSVTSDSLLVNAGFNGASDIRLLSNPVNALEVGEEKDLFVVVDLEPSPTGTYESNVLASAEFNGFEVTDTSQNGFDPDPDGSGPENNTEATPVCTTFIDIDSISNTVCNAAVGSVTFTVSSAGTITVAGQTATVTAGDLSATFSNLTAGFYTAVFSTATGCSNEVSFNVINTNSDLEASIAAFENISCAGETDGSFTIAATGGTGTYTFRVLETAETNATGVFEDFSAGNYNVLVTDANGCSFTVAVTLTIPNPLVTSLISVVNESCFGANDGAVRIGATGGTSGYSYAISTDGGVTFGVAQSNPLFSNLAPGSYTFRTIDANDCESNEITVVITGAASALTIDAADETNPSCFGATDGGIELTVSGGTGPYTYLWSNGQSGANLVNVGAGTYTVTIRDANGCTLASPVYTLTSPGAVTVTATSIANTECNASVGSVVLTSSDGSDITLNGVTQASGSTFTGLAAGFYTAVSGGTCAGETTFNIINTNSTLTASVTNINMVTVAGGNNGSATITAVGGAAPITYTLLGAGTTNGTGEF
ncbi:MAG: PKD-like domain-containing protein, partial [Mongoliitalea sp.]